MNSVPWRFHLFEPVVLEGPDGARLAVERKTAACLAYLALEGPTTRARLVGLLWPTSPEATARNNLSQLLRKLRLATGQEWVAGADILTLSADLVVDALEARDLYTRGRHAEFLDRAGGLLGGLVYDDCPELEDWLLSEQERWAEWRAHASRAEADRLERDGALDDAAVLVRALLDLDPISEEAWRRLMRLHYLRGDRAAALKAYHKCREVLRREFGADPLPETAALAAQIERGTVPSVHVVKPSALPLAVQRPPNLVGREAEWASLEAAWGTVPYIYLRGAPGAGKTRLAQEFAASKGEFFTYAGRPGDAHVPFASSARNVRLVLERWPDVPIAEWVRKELSRVVPELARPDETLQPLRDEADVLRLRQAMQVFFLERTRHLACVLVDDWQFYDYHSNQDGVFMWTQPPPAGSQGRMPPMLVTYRRDEVAPESEALILRIVEEGLGVLIDVEPLGEDGLDALMADVGVPSRADVRARLRAHSGGNPLFLLETIRHLIQTNQLTEDLPERLPLPPKVGQLVERRLGLVSTPALQAARAAAVLQRDFDVELIAETLGAPVLDLLSAWEELEGAQIVRGDGFSHDLVAEAVRQSVPSSVRPLLHRGAARALERHGAHPARIARHWLEGGKPALAAPLLLKAAEVAAARFLRDTAAENLGEAADAFWAAGELDAAFDAWNRQGEALFYLERAEDLGALARRLHEWAVTPRRRAIAHRLESAALTMAGEADRAAELAEQGLAWAEQTADPRLEADLLEVLVFASYLRRFVPNPTAWLDRMLAIGETHGNTSLRAKTHELYGLYLVRHQPREALQHVETAERLFRSSGDVQSAVSCAQKSASVQVMLGDVRAARGALDRMRTDVRAGADYATQRVFMRLTEAHCDHAEGRFAHALRLLDEAKGIEIMHAALWQPEIDAWRAVLLAELGAFDEALSLARALLASLPASANQLPEPRVLVAHLFTDLGCVEEARAAIREAARVGDVSVWWTARLDLVRAAHLPPRDRLSLLEDTRAKAREHGLRGVAVAAEVRLNAARLALDLPATSWSNGDEIGAAGTISLAEELDVRARVAAATSPELGAAARDAFHAWVQRAAREDVPPAYLASFLNQPRLRPLAVEDLAAPPASTR
ncbi:BTAD domain-containing putative transcriptional regulator [Deinococcus yavapaiensis]|uniref:DNA-binding SARP family transcriptional activator n=1 Tax=Deinococcus yavapaiensis KR-236 TaxID=694435 RepID=A0A318SDI7_9DEIO|nr:BTAD domain-containing putative transcriptional regulator [Deinococcus yavapaiensis]PYE55444.1 DNA-binding SARP family transcriptional activator [Deinococcus yavapaiensis KR-236]